MSYKDLVEKYGVPVGILLVIVLMFTVLPGNTTTREVSTTGDGSTASGDEFAAGSGGDVTGGATGGDVVGGNASGATGGTGAGAAAGGSAGAASGSSGAASGGSDVVFGQGPCRADGRQAGISRYMPPCVKWNSRENGGATGRGVTGDKILVIRFVPQTDAATTAILQGAKLSDPPEVVSRAFQALVRYGNLHYETYGREVVLQDYAASGPSDSDEAMKADAIKIANDIKPFLVMGAPNAAAVELSQRGVPCLCTVSLSSAFYNALPAPMIGSLPTSDEYAINAGEYACKRLKGRKAKWAGPSLQSKDRVFGLIYIEGQGSRIDPESVRFKQLFSREFGKCGIKFASERAYLYDPGANQQDVTSIIASMKAAGVTTIVPVWDPIYPILITTEATKQSYFPEWFIVGTGLSDTSAAGRLYNQEQWTHAFGISPLWVTWQTVAKSPGFREYHHAVRGAPGDEGVLIAIYRSSVQALFRGIHMAGPRLTTDSWLQGQFRYPKSGGTASSPLVFITKQYPTEIKDFVEVWYDPSRKGPDERGLLGTGMVIKVDGGKRYLPGQWPTSEPKAFDPAGAVDVTDNPLGGGDPDHEQDGHTHPASQRCLSCT